MPDSLLQYRIEEKIGAGGMGVVWRAFDTRLHREVALKVLPADQNDRARRARMLQEARSASALNHPNIVTIYGVDTDGGTDFIAMELVRGQTLHDLLHSGPVPPRLAIRYAMQICDALAAAHSAGVIHRDLKPANIMITSTGHVKVVDFGIAKLNQAPDTTGGVGETLTVPLTSEDVVLGTLAYMSPEQALGDHVDRRSDIFSFGVVLYQMLQGKMPFRGETRSQILRSLLSDQPPAVVTPIRTNGRSLDSVIRKCLAKQPEDRYDTAADVLEDLRALDRKMGNVPGGDGGFMRKAVVGAAALVALSALLLFAYRDRVSARWLPALQTPATSQDWYVKGRALLERWDREGAADGAVDAMNHAIQLDSNHAISYAGLAEAYTLKDVANADPQWRKLATDAGRKAVSLNDDIAQSHLSLGTALARDDQHEEAMRQFERASQLDPGNGLARLSIANEQSAKKDYAGALESYQRARALSPASWAVPYAMGRFYYGQARYADAVAQWRAAKKLTPDNVAVLSNLAAGLHMSGQDSEAAAEFQRALEIRPSAATYNNLGTQRYYMGEYDSAVTSFEKAVAMNANRYMYWGNLGDAYRWSTGSKAKAGGTYLRAIQLVDEKVAAQPADSDLRSTLAIYRAKNGAHAEALNDIAAAMMAKPSARAWFNAMIVFEICGKREQALSALGSAVRAGFPLHEIRNEPELVSLRTDMRYHSTVSPAANPEPGSGPVAADRHSQPRPR